MGGLKAKIANGIRMFKPQSLKEAINLARIRDDQLSRQRRFMRLPPARAPLALPQATHVAPTAPARPIKCHRCQKPQVLLLEGHVGNVIYEDITDQQMLEHDHGGDVAEVQEPELGPEISLHALTGWTAPKTMRVRAKMGPHEVMVLIDIGSTHNFISNRLASMLRLPIILTETFPVRVANGERLTCQGRYDKENQDRKLQGVDVQTIQAISSKEISKEFRRGHVLFAVCFQPTMGTVPPDALS
ncbi:hypothetical protein Pint_22709 [Pistacia integerrima]|uniref:Uncharacterized protein n=1 Tax=Pistacia integerrima TaxID=434235 RepID=A0ACC0YHI5_9ROSI|nr:hypothetical protein Pint_22709 [Pistacia integerrima]